MAPDRLPVLAASRSAFVEVDGIRLHYLLWNGDRTDLPPLLLVHGFLAHAHWWDTVAPQLAQQYRVYAPDLSGMGESGWRDHYTVDAFAAEISGLIDALGLAPVTAIAHSYGGARLLRACHDRPELFSHAIVIDSFIHFEDTPRALPPRINPPRINPSLGDAMARYRLLPAEPNVPAATLANVARRALGQVDGGWRLRFDPALAPNGEREIDGAVQLPHIATPVDVIYGQYSQVVSTERAERTVALLPRGRGPFMLAGGHHHLMLDQPETLLALLRQLLASA